MSQVTVTSPKTPSQTLPHRGDKRLKFSHNDWPRWRASGAGWGLQPVHKNCLTYPTGLCYLSFTMKFSGGVYSYVYDYFYGCQRGTVAYV